MIKARIKKGTFKGRTSIIMESDELKAIILPELGSKMVSLTAKSTGREFLYQGPFNLEEYKLPNYGDPYDNYDISGFDECFPVILESQYPFPPYEGEIIPDHGEVWCQSWNYSIEENGLNMSVKGIKFPFTLSKKLSFNDKSSIRIEYKITNLSQHNFAFIWCPHVLLNCSEKTGVIFPKEVKKIIQSMPEGSLRLGDHLLKYSYPVCKDIYGEEYRLDSVYPIESNRQEKFYSAEKVKEGWCAIHHTDTNEIFGLSYPSEKIPYIGQWVSHGGFMKQHVIALEPVNIPLDTLESAIKAGFSIDSLQPFGEFTWYFNISVKKSDKVSFINSMGEIV